MQNKETVFLSEDEWNTFDKQGYVRIGKVLSDEELNALSNRINEIMLGEAEIDYDRLLMQKEVESVEADYSHEQSKGFKGSSFNYRKIQNLELDPLYHAYIRKPLFQQICARVYDERPISCFRAMFMNKAAQYGSFLPFHQDVWSSLDRDPLITVWTALDPATQQNGCVQVIPGTHKFVINPSHSSGFLTKEQTKELLAKHSPVYLEMQPGEAVLLHNWLVHGSDINRSDKSRRAFSVSYMDAATRSTLESDFSIVFDQ